MLWCRAFWLVLPELLGLLPASGGAANTRVSRWLRIWQLVQQQFFATGIAGWNFAILLEFRSFSRKVEHALEQVALEQVWLCEQAAAQSLSVAISAFVR
eukprot:COSAG06_NODE_6540_length_2889_cov_20.829317_2_plen_99_part_00